MLTAGALLAARVGVVVGVGLATVAVGVVAPTGEEALVAGTDVLVVALGCGRGVAGVLTTAAIVPAT